MEDIYSPYRRNAQAILRGALHIAILASAMAKRKINELPNNIREYRVRARMTMRELAARTGLTHQYVSMLERGAKPLVDRTLILMSEALGVEKTKLIKVAAEPRLSDAIENDVELMLLRFWRSLPPEGKHVALLAMTQWATDRLGKALAS